MRAKQSEDKTLLEVSDMDCFYADLKVLRSVSLKIIKSEIVALFGPNGHGKSTLLKAISGIHPPRSGTIRFKGQDITFLPSDKKVAMGLVYIPEDRSLFPEMTVLENLTMGAFNRRARRNIDQNLEYVFSLFPRLVERRRHLALNLSGGESRMLAVGRGLMSQASLLLIDEPSIGLSPLYKKMVFEAIAKLRKNSDTTILIVEQEVDYPLKMADTVYLLKKGRIILNRHSNEITKAQIEKAYF